MAVTLPEGSMCILPHCKKLLRNGQRMWQRTQCVDLASQLLRAQSHWASVGYSSKSDHWNPHCGSYLALNPRGINTRHPGVSCAIWDQGVGYRSFDSLWVANLVCNGSDLFYKSHRCLNGLPSGEFEGKVAIGQSLVIVRQHLSASIWIKPKEGKAYKPLFASLNSLHLPCTHNNIPLLHLQCNMHFNVCTMLLTRTVYMNSGHRCKGYPAIRFGSIWFNFTPVCSFLQKIRYFVVFRCDRSYKYTSNCLSISNNNNMSNTRSYRVLYWYNLNNNQCSLSV